MGLEIMASAKQIAWRKKFAKMAKSGKFRKKKSSTKSNPHGKTFRKTQGGYYDKPTEGAKMKIDKRTETSVYITIGDWEVYLDNSTGERIIDQWSV